MGYKVIWTDEAIADLRELVAFISKENPDAGEKLGEILIQKSMVLVEHPHLGRKLRKSPSNALRELIVPPYRMFYEIDEKGSAVFIRFLWDGARQEPKIS
jgi:toxin ParE1/3/4